MATREILEANKLLACRAIEEIWNQQKLGAVEEIYAPDYTYHGPTGDYDHNGRKQFITTYLRAFPDIHFTIDDTIAERDKVAIRWTATATHRGEIMGISPTGAYGTTTGITVVRIASGKIAEERVDWDVLAMLQNMGAIPSDREGYTWGEPTKVTGATGTPEENKAIVMRYNGIWNRRESLDALGDVMSEEVINHDPVLYPGTDFERHRKVILMYLNAFPDLHAPIDELIAEGDKVVGYGVATGTQRGELMGVPPTGRKVSWTYTAIFRIADGRIVETWWSYDVLGLMRQLGVLPSSAGSPSSQV